MIIKVFLTLLVAGLSFSQITYADPATLASTALRNFERLERQLPFDQLSDRRAQAQARNTYATANDSLRAAIRDLRGHRRGAQGILNEAYANYLRVGLMLPLTNDGRGGRGGRGGHNTLDGYLDALTTLNQALSELSSGPVRPGPRPGPGPGPRPGPVLRKVDIESFVVGTDSFRNSGDATSDWQNQCNRMHSTINSTAGSQNVETFNCGNPANVSNYANIGYSLFGSTASYTVGYRSVDAVIASPGSNVLGAEDRNSAPAYRTWFERCLAEMASAKSTYGNRFVAASCGQPRNVSQYAQIGYFQFQSTMMLFLLPLQ